MPNHDSTTVKRTSKRILMLLENSSYPRDERVRHEANSLTAAGYEITVIAPIGNGQSWRETINGVHVIRYPRPPASDSLFGYLWEYAYSILAIFVTSIFLMLRYNFAVIHAHQPPDTFVLIAGFYKLFGKRYILDHHDLAPDLYYARFRGKGNRFIFQVLIFFEKFACRLADQVIATNQSYKEIEMQRGKVPEENIMIVRNGPDFTEVDYETQDQVNGENSKLILGYLGVMGIQDGVDYLLRALSILKNKPGRKDFYCKLVGSGDALPSLKTLSHELDLDEYVQFVGWVDSQVEVARYLNSFDVCIAPEPSDPYNDRSTAAKVMEYMAVGKPVVCFDLPEHRFTAQEAGCYAKINDEEDLAEKIALLMDNPDLRTKMGRFGKQRIMDQLSWQQQEKNLLQAYQHLFTGKNHEF